MTGKVGEPRCRRVTLSDLWHTVRHRALTKLRIHTKRAQGAAVVSIILVEEEFTVKHCEKPLRLHTTLKDLQRLEVQKSTLEQAKFTKTVHSKVVSLEIKQKVIGSHPGVEI